MFRPKKEHSMSIAGRELNTAGCGLAGAFQTECMTPFAAMKA